MILLSLTSALLGWLVITLAVTLIFKPRQPLKLGPWILQGILPRYRPELLAFVSELASNELISPTTIIEKVQQVNIQDDVSTMLASRIDIVLNKFAQKNPMIGMFVNDSLKAEIKGLVVAEIVSELPALQGTLAQKMVGQFDIKALLQEKLSKLDFTHLEGQIEIAVRKNVCPLQCGAAAVGFLFGLLQWALIG